MHGATEPSTTLQPSACWRPGLTAAITNRCTIHDTPSDGQRQAAGGMRGRG